MDISYKWLQQFVELNVSARDFMHKMCMSGTEVKGFSSHSDKLKNIAVGKITEVRKHPDADKLQICIVDIGADEPIQIVTAATNVFAGALVPVALHNSLLFDGTKITKGKLRGEVSNGMFCSVAELGLTVHDYPGAVEDGILILKEGVPGEDICKNLGLDDVVFEVDVVTNRPDCLCVKGIARESAATFGLPFKSGTPKINKFLDEDISDYLSVSVENTELCPRYMARVVKNIQIGPSPLWMVERLRNSGVRSINNIVDITNYVMLEYGQPMHAFDYSCVDGKIIIVRDAAESENITTLDGAERILNSSMLVIADEKKPIALAGVMGGENSEIKETTDVIVFESANFHGASVRKTSKALGMRTESSSRFEKSLDPVLAEEALDRACELIEMLGAGEIVSGKIDVSNFDKALKTIPLEQAWINKYLNTDISVKEMSAILQSLGFDVNDGIVTVPSFRSDVFSKYDLSEEIARFYGYDNIKSAALKMDVSGGGYSDEQKFVRRINETLRAVGLSEIMTYSFISPKAFDKLSAAKDDPVRNCLKIINPLGEDSSIMRTTMLPSMLEVLSRNYNNRNAEAYLYEIGKVYIKNKEDGKLPDERDIITVGFYDNAERSDFFTLKGMIEELVASMNIKSVSYKPCKDNLSYHPGRAAYIESDGKIIGVFGQLHPSVQLNYEIEKTVFCAEISLMDMYNSRAEERKYKPLPKYPASVRDIALICKNEVYSSDVENIIRSACGSVLEDLRLFDFYIGKQVEEGYKSLAYSLTFRKEEGTMSDTEVDKIISSVLNSLEIEGIKLRQ